jgi:lambda family phage portal protein
VWKRWWEVCDYDGLANGPDKLALWVVQLWKYGEFFEQFVNDSDGPAELPQLRLRSIHPDRIETDVASALTSLGADGVILAEDGRRVGYRVKQEIPGSWVWQHETVLVDQMVHYFELTEPGQLRGIPWIASALPVLADIRELDKSVLAAMRTSAEMAAVMESQPNGENSLEPVTLDDDTELELKRNAIVKVPQGWGIKQLKAEQPGLQHVPYRHDRLREIGRGRGMSLLHVLADGRDHTYSSMRGDNQMLDMVLGNDRGKFERKALTRVFRAVMAEAVLMGLVEPLPVDLRINWVWPAREYIDPMKEAQGQIESMRAGIKTLHEICAERGVDYDEHVRVLENERNELERRGLLHLLEQATVGAVDPEDDNTAEA